MKKEFFKELSLLSTQEKKRQKSIFELYIRIVRAHKGANMTNYFFFLPFQNRNLNNNNCLIIE